MLPELMNQDRGIERFSTARATADVTPAKGPLVIVDDARLRVRRPPVRSRSAA
jgi:hypothetical protein